MTEESAPPVRSETETLLAYLDRVFAGGDDVDRDAASTPSARPTSCGS